MMQQADDLVAVAYGPPAEMEAYRGILTAAGIDARVVGEDLAAGLGTALPGSVELWVRRADADEARAAIRAASRPAPHPAYPHPASDPKPVHARGVVHGAPRHRPLPRPGRSVD